MSYYILLGSVVLCYVVKYDITLHVVALHGMVQTSVYHGNFSCFYCIIQHIILQVCHITFFHIVVRFYAML